MKNILVIGSTVVDVIIELDHLPVTCEDVNVRGQTMAMGGCAYNAFSMARRFGPPCVLFSPVGTGAYGDFVRTHLARQGISTPIPTPQRENGCCYCFVEKGGERTFISYHGAEYAFERAWFDALDVSDIGGAYLCGLEVEEPTGWAIVEFLEKNPAITPYFAPGPRITRIEREKVERIFARRPILHLNEEEAVAAAALYAAPADGSVEAAAAALQRCTENTVVVTLGERGCLYHTGTEWGSVPGFSTVPVDTIGAGDAHIGALMALLHGGVPLRDALRTANRMAAAVVGVKGALLSEEQFAAAMA